MRVTWLIGTFFLFGCGASAAPPSSNADVSIEGHGGGSTASGATTGGSIEKGGEGEAAGAAQNLAGSQVAGGSVSMGGSQNEGGSQNAGGNKDAGAMRDATINDASGASEASAKVLPCNGVNKGNGWENISPPGDLGDVCAVQLDPLNVGTLYVQMHKGGNGGHAPTDGLYKSTDCGSSWNIVTPGKNARDHVQGEVNIYSGSIVSLIVDPVVPGLIYIVSNYGPSGVWRSTNGGVDWEQTIPADLFPYLPSNGWFNALSMDPTDHRHLVGATHTGCTGKYAPNCLAETRDGGNTWRLIHAPQTINEASGPYVHDSHTMVYASGQNGLHLTTNDYPDNDSPMWTQVAGGANGGDTGLFAYQAKNGKYYLGTDFGIAAGSSDFKSWTMDQASVHQALFVIGDGEKLFAAVRGGPFYTTPEANPGTWTMLQATGNPPKWAGRWLLYESTHHILYSSIWETGIYRMVTP
jgi:hypothetical protein